MKTIYSNRLYEEWKIHGKIIIAVDFDDTLKNWKLKDYETMDRTLDLVRKCQSTGAYVVVFTACQEDRYAEIKKFCEAYGIRLDSINQNPISLPYGNETKIYANIFLDDRAGINEALDTLETALYSYRGYLQNNNIQGEQAE